MVTSNYSEREQALYKNACLIDEQYDMREGFCGLGTRKVKLFLNQKIKKGDNLAKLLRVAIELADVNVSAKKYWGNFKRDYYSRKHDLLLELSHIYQDRGDLDYGYQYNPGRLTTHILYFELPNGEQISFHCTLSNPKSIPQYTKEWDRQENSTFVKLERAVELCYGDELRLKYKYLKSVKYENIQSKESEIVS